MNSRLPSLLLILFGGFLAAAKQVPSKSSSSEPVSIHVQYLKTGREADDVAERLGKVEIANSNPCVAKMRGDLHSYLDRQELKDAIREVSKVLDGDKKPLPALVLRYMNEAMELRFEMRLIPEKDRSGIPGGPEKVVYRRGIFISNLSGTWQDRLGADQCNVSEEKFIALIDELREADRLASCISRKKEIIGSSEKLSNYIHNYLPADWLEDAKKQLALLNNPVRSLLRDDFTVYRQGNSTFRDCLRGLRLLEEDAASSVRVLNQVRESKKGTEVPHRQIEELEGLLSGIGK